MAVQNPPEGYHSVTPYLTVDDARAALDFYKAAFGATEITRMEMGGKIGHAEIRIGDSIIMLADEWPDYGKLSPKTRGGATSSLMIYLPDVDAAYQRAIDAGATAERPVQDQFYGDRSGGVTDPFGHSWSLSTHIEDIEDDEMQRRMDAAAKEMA
jgi:PhnB protein